MKSRFGSTLNKWGYWNGFKNEIDKCSDEPYKEARAVYYVEFRMYRLIRINPR